MGFHKIPIKSHKIPWISINSPLSECPISMVPRISGFDPPGCKTKSPGRHLAVAPEDRQELIEANVVPLDLTWISPGTYHIYIYTSIYNICIIIYIYIYKHIYIILLISTINCIINQLSYHKSAKIPMKSSFFWVTSQFSSGFPMVGTTLQAPAVPHVPAAVPAVPAVPAVSSMSSPEVPGLRRPWNPKFYYMSYSQNLG